MQNKHFYQNLRERDFKIFINKILWHSITKTSSSLEQNIISNYIPCLTAMLGLCKPSNQTKQKQNMNISFIIFGIVSVHIKKTTQKLLYFQSGCTRNREVSTNPNRDTNFTPTVRSKRDKIETKCYAKRFQRSYHLTA